MPTKKTDDIEYMDVDHLTVKMLERPDSLDPMRNLLKEFRNVLDTVIKIHPEWKLIVREMMGRIYLDLFK